MMLPKLPKLTGVDHIHLYVSDREQAALWYQQHLGFQVNEDLRFWADDVKGPLTIEGDGGIHLALFQRAEFAPGTAIAFGCDGENFVAWLRHFERIDALVSYADHDVTWSLYFKDLDGNMSEITTFDHGYVKAQLAS